MLETACVKVLVDKWDSRACKEVQDSLGVPDYPGGLDLKDFLELQEEQVSLEIQEQQVNSDCFH